MSLILKPKSTPVFIDGQKVKTLHGEGIVAEFTRVVDDYVAQRFGGAGAGKAAE